LSWAFVGRAPKTTRLRIERAASADDRPTDAMIAWPASGRSPRVARGARGVDRRRDDRPLDKGVADP
jgi:hypothetical protein